MSYINKTKFQPIRATSQFTAIRREWERVLDRGHSFAHLSYEFPLEKKYRMYMSESKKKERERIRAEKYRDEQREMLIEQGITDELEIERELAL